VNPEHTLLTPQQLAQRSGVTTDHLANLRSQGRGPTYVKPGPRRVRDRLSDVLAHEEASRVEPGKGKQHTPRRPGVFR
jgi:hypothetical protein